MRRAPGDLQTSRRGDGEEPSWVERYRRVESSARALIWRMVAVQLGTR